MISVVRGHGSYLPARIIKNSDLEKNLDTSDAWIQERTGITQRHVAAEGEFTSHLGTKAALAALQNAGLKPEDIDLLIVATSTPDDTMPSTAVKIQHAIGMTRGAAFDVNAVCAGFVYAMTIADNFIRTGSARRVLVIGAETMSRILDWNDRTTCILFGDGAGALVLEAADETKENRGVLLSRIHSDGQYYDILHATGGVSSTKTAGFIVMNGKEVFRHAVAKMSDVVAENLAALSLTMEDVSWVIPHQANVRILQSVAKRLAIPDEKLISTVALHANTSAASIPLAISHAAAAGKIKPGQILVLPALGSGLTWGTCIIRW